MDLGQIITIKKSYSETDFLRNVLIGLSKDDKSPSNIMEAKFGKVIEYTKEVIIVTADVKVDYSGSVGYDRQEQYQTTEYKRVYEGEWYTINGVQKRATTTGSYLCDVIKTRTVTDWSAHSGSLNTNKTRCAINEDVADRELERLFVEQMSNLKGEYCANEGSAVLNNLAYTHAVDSCEIAARCEVSWPGDHHKDETYSYQTNVAKCDCFIAPCYEVEYEYEGQKYTARGFAYGQPNETHTLPETSQSAKSVSDIEKECWNKESEAEKPLVFKTISTVLAIISGILLAYGFLNQGLPDSGATTCLAIGKICFPLFVVLAILIKLIVWLNIKRINREANIEKNNLRNGKALNLIKVIEQMELKELSKEELNGISKDDDFVDKYGTGDEVYLK